MKRKSSAVSTPTGERALKVKFGEVLVKDCLGRVVGDDGKVLCVCGCRITANSKALNQHVGSNVHIRAVEAVEGNMTIEDCVDNSSRNRTVTRLSLSHNIPIETMHAVITDASFILAMNTATPSAFNTPVHQRSLAIRMLGEERRNLREKISALGDFSLAIDETRRGDARPMTSVLIKTFEKTYFYRSFDMNSLDADAFIGCLAEVLDGIDGEVRFDRSRVLQVMADNCNTMKSLKNRISGELNLDRMFYPGDCVSHALNTIEEHIFLEFVGVKRLVHGVHKALWGAGELCSRRQKLLASEVKIPSSYPGGAPSSIKIPVNQLNKLRCKTTRWHARMASLEVISSYRPVLRDFFVRLKEDIITAGSNPSKAVARAAAELDNDESIFMGMLISSIFEPFGVVFRRSQGRKHTFSSREMASIDEVGTNSDITGKKHERDVEIDRDLLKSLWVIGPNGARKNPFLSAAKSQAMRILIRSLNISLSREIRNNEKLDSARLITQTIDFFVPAHAVHLPAYLLREIANSISLGAALRTVGGNRLVQVADCHLEETAFFYAREGDNHGSAHEDDEDDDDDDDDELVLSYKARKRASNFLFVDLKAYSEMLLAAEGRSEGFEEYIKFWSVGGVGESFGAALHMLAKSVLSLSVSNATVESSFSSWRRIDTNTR